MKDQKKVALPGSHKNPHQSEITTKIDGSATMEVTIRIRRKKSLEPKLLTDERISHENYEKEFGASREDAMAVEAFAHEHQLNTIDINLARRSIILRGSVTNMEAAFNVTLISSKDTSGNSYRVRQGDIFVPESLAAIIEGVFGLDNRPAARPMFQVALNNDGNQFISHAAAPRAFNPNELADIYGFPAGTGKGECIGIIELGGGYRTDDITTYFNGLGINIPSIKAMAVDGGINAPSTADTADGEVMLDIEVAGAVAPDANLIVYFCPNTDQGFLDGITTAIHDTANKPSVISISWGSAEVNWTQQSLNSFNEAFKAAAVLGVTICVASGDSGSSDSIADGKVHVDFPASSPYVLACGGTSLTVNNGLISSETVWHDSNSSAGGGGVSNFFALPDYQASANVPFSIDTQNKGRGVPDVAADADPNTGYKVLVDGQAMIIGGTSAVAPLMAGLIARVNQVKNRSAGFINPVLYADPSLCRDITIGNNKTTSANTGYSAGPGWDACTGWGVLIKL